MNESLELLRDLARKLEKRIGSTPTTTLDVRIQDSYDVTVGAIRDIEVAQLQKPIFNFSWSNDSSITE